MRKLRNRCDPYCPDLKRLFPGPETPFSGSLLLSHNGSFGCYQDEQQSAHQITAVHSIGRFQLPSPRIVPCGVRPLRSLDIIQALLIFHKRCLAPFLPDTGGRLPGYRLAMAEPDGIE